MIDRESRRFDILGRVQKFGRDNAAGSKALTRFANLAQLIKDLYAAEAQQDGGGAIAKSVLLDSLRLDLQNIARTAEVAVGNDGG